MSPKCLKPPIKGKPPSEGLISRELLSSVEEVLSRLSSEETEQTKTVVCPSCRHRFVVRVTTSVDFQTVEKDISNKLAKPVEDIIVTPMMPPFHIDIDIE